MTVSGLVVVVYTSPQEDTAPGAVAVAAPESQDPAGTLQKVTRLVSAEVAAIAAAAIVA